MMSFSDYLNTKLDNKSIIHIGKIYESVLLSNDADFVINISPIKQYFNTAEAIIYLIIRENYIENKDFIVKNKDFYLTIPAFKNLILFNFKLSQLYLNFSMAKMWYELFISQ